MTLRIVADENIPGVSDAFAPLGNVETVNGRDLRQEQVANADVLLVRSVTRVDESLLGGSTVRFVGTATSGCDHVDRDYLASADIDFAAAPGANANSVVEYVLAAISATGDTLESLLSGAGSVGIVGYGHIGRLLRQRLDALQVRSRIYDPWLDMAQLPDCAALADIFSCSVISLHPELTDEKPWPSRHLVGGDELRQLSAATLLINASRGAIVDNRALGHSLASRGGPVAVLDVWEGEPAIDTDLLKQVAIGTAHIAGYSHDGKLRGTSMLLDACKASLGLDSLTVEPLAGAAPDIDLPAGLNAADTVRYLLAQRYDIMEDDGLLRQAMRVAGNERARAFDELRRSYRRRGELAGSTVKSKAPGAEAEHIVNALGCALEHVGK